jgi:hypothetical protein
LVGHESAILADGRDSKVRDGALGLGGTVHVDDPNIGCQRLQTVTVSLGKNVSDKEGVLQGRDLAGGLGRQKLTHGRGQVGHRDLAISHPLSESTRSTDIVGGRHVKLSSQEQGRED